jgi:acetoin utilization protein AcuB
MTEDVVRIDMDTRGEQILERFRETGFRHAVVIERGTPIGVISDRDVLRTVSPFVGKMAERNVDRHTLERRAHQVMTRELITVRAESTAVDAAMLMHKHHISCVPVLNRDRQCVGIFTWRNAIAWAACSLGSGDSFCAVSCAKGRSAA